VNTDTRSNRRAILRKILRHYHRPIIKAYVYGRFKIINLDILERIESHLPQQGRILDVGCGFGLFDLYFALTGPERTIHGVDLNLGRLDIATQAAEELGLKNLSFDQMDVGKTQPKEPCDAMVTLDILHHVPPAAAEKLLQVAYECLAPGGVLIAKDVDTTPTWQRWFTWWMDKLMDPKTKIHYRHHLEWKEVFEKIGFEVEFEKIKDPLPYPHILLIGRKP
jgi:2-polyprenyl-3-methyl-5-hydroxy-6-metoxy-1,4-benzoquinol methylase